MAATFYWAQYTGSSGASSTPANLASPATTLTSSNAAMSWDFETADSTGTQSYTQNPVSAGSNSWPVWLKGYFTNGNNFTVSNVKFWQFTPAQSAANTQTFTIYGTVQTAYSVATGTATGAAFASNVAVPIGANSTQSPAGALGGSTLTFGSFGSGAGTTGVLQNYLCLQLVASAGAPAGTSGYFGFTMQYDEC